MRTVRFQQTWLLSLVGLVALVSVYAQDKPQTNLAFEFEGNRVFSSPELSDVLSKCLATDPKWSTTHNPEMLDYCLHTLQFFLQSKGYLQAKVGKPAPGPHGASKLVVNINEGLLFKLGQIKIEGSTLFSEERLLATLDLKAGDIVNPSCLTAWAYQTLKKMYGEQGYIQYTAEFQSKFRKNADGEGIVDFLVYFDEGDLFKVKSINFVGNGDVAADWLLREMLLRTGDVFNQQLLEDSVRKLNQTELFETIDQDKDVDYRADRKSPLLDLTIRLKRKKS